MVGKCIYSQRNNLAAVTLKRGREENGKVHLTVEKYGSISEVVTVIHQTH